MEVGAALVDGQHLVDDSGAAGGGVGEIRVRGEGRRKGRKGVMEGDRVEGDEGRWRVDVEEEEGGRRRGGEGEGGGGIFMIPLPRSVLIFF